MKQFSLKRVIITNFRSIKDACVEFTNTAGLKLLSGQNNCEPRLGANGSGKSSLWQAICWCLYGTGVKNERISSLLTWGEKSSEVLIELSVNNEIHTVYRSGPPVKIEIDGKEKTQEKLDEFLGLTKDRFLHSVLFGQGAPLLPDKTIPERGELLDEVLQLQIWEEATKRAGKKCTDIEKDITSRESKLSYVNGQISQIQSDQQIEAQIEHWEGIHKIELETINTKLTQWEEDRDARLEELERQMSNWKDEKAQELENNIREVQNYESELELLKAQLQSLPKHDTKKIDKQVKENESKLTKLQAQYTEIETKLKFTIKPRDFWAKNNICPTCLNPISDEIKQLNLTAIDTQEQEFTNKLDDLNEKIEEAKNELLQSRTAQQFIVATISQADEQKRNTEANIRRLEKQITGVSSIAEKLGADLESNNNPFFSQYERLVKEVNTHVYNLEAAQSRKNPYTDLLEQNKKLREDLEQQKETLSTEIKQVKQSLVAAEYWKHGFKRIRLFFVNQILSALQIEIQGAMSALGLDNWTVKITTESMTKSETVKLGVQILIKSPVAEGEWTSWSGGESQRLRLGIAMGFGSLIQRAAGCFWNLEVWDEPGQHLSEQGMEDLLEALRYRAEALNKSVYITHHSALIYSGFTEIWKAVKDEAGSSIVLIGD